MHVMLYLKTPTIYVVIVITVTSTESLTATYAVALQFIPNLLTFFSVSLFFLLVVFFISDGAANTNSCYGVLWTHWRT